MKAARDASCIVPIETTASSTESVLVTFTVREFMYMVDSANLFIPRVHPLFVRLWYFVHIQLSVVCSGEVLAE